MSSTTTVDGTVAATHAALFDNFFPIDAVPESVRPLVQARAEVVSEEMLQAAESAPELMALLQVLTDPSRLPEDLRVYLKSLGDSVVNAFLRGGFASLPAADRDVLWDRFLTAAQPPLTRMAATVRLIYTSRIWDLPLAGPIVGIQDPKVFIDNLDVWVAAHRPAVPAGVLRYDEDSATITCTDDNPIDFLVVGSGPGGATVAAELRAAGARVVVVEKGPFVIWGSMDTRSYSTLMYKNNAATTSDGAILIRSGQTVGGGTTVNIDLAFSPVEATVQTRIQSWIAEGLLDPELYGIQALASAYDWVRATIETRELSESELNRDNLVLWEGAKAFGVDPSLYHLNRFPQGRSPSAVDDKRDAARQLLLPAMQEQQNPLSLIPDAAVEEILFQDPENPLLATGVRITAQEPWTEHGNTLVDPCGLGIRPGQSATIQARNIVLGAGAIGSSRLLLQTARANPSILDASPTSHIGAGLVLHPSVPIIGLFDQPIDLLEGLDSAAHVDSFGPTPGFIFETMSGLPAYGAALIPGNARQVFDVLSRYQNSAGFGLMRIDSSSLDNRIVLNETGDDVDLVYTLTPEDIRELQRGLAIGIRMMFLAGAYEVVIPSNENVLGMPDFRPTDVTYLTHIAQADLVEENIKYLPNRTLLTAAHLQATNRMGATPHTGAISPNHRVWSVKGQEIPNLYVMDASIFPTSVGANPMQSIYTFAKIFSERLIAGLI